MTPKIPKTTLLPAKPAQNDGQVSLFNSFTSKQKRSLKCDIDLIFSIKGLSFPKTIDDIRKIGWFTPQIKYKDKKFYLSKDGARAIARICETIESTKAYKNRLNYNDIYQGVKGELEEWLDKDLIPDPEEFLPPLEQRLSKKIRTYSFMCRVEGIKLDGLTSIKIGTKTIEQYDPDKLQASRLPIGITPESITEEYGKGLVIRGRETGSKEVAQEKFYFNSEIALSVLRMFGCAFYKQAIQMANLRLVNDCHGAYGKASCLSWDTESKSPGYTQYFKKEQDLPINQEIIEQLTKNCFFELIGEIIEKEKKTELEEAITTAIYWFGEAHKDRNNTTKFVKLWQSAECFFSITKDNITEINAKAITALLTFGGYQIVQPDEYTEFKAEIKRLYKPRSKAIHRGRYNHIDIPTLQKFSYRIAWVIITMASLVSRGYKTISQVLEQTNRLDKLETEHAAQKRQRKKQTR